jgi:hypothetical protein
MDRFLKLLKLVSEFLGREWVDQHTIIFCYVYNKSYAFQESPPPGSIVRGKYSGKLFI